MRRDQVFKVCANHVISKTVGLKTLNVSDNALVWTTLDYAGDFLDLNANFISFLDFSEIHKKHKTTYKLC